MGPIKGKKVGNNGNFYNMDQSNFISDFPKLIGGQFGKQNVIKCWKYSGSIHGERNCISDPRSFCRNTARSMILVLGIVTYGFKWLYWYIDTKA